MATVLTQHDRELIADNWARVLISRDLSLNDIIKIVVQYGNQFAQFDSALSVHANITFDKDDLIFAGINLNIYDKNLYIQLT